MIDELGPQDSVAIYTFDERLTVRQEFTTDKDAAKRAILRTRAQGERPCSMLSLKLHRISRNGRARDAHRVHRRDDNSSALNANAAVGAPRRSAFRYTQLPKETQ